MFCKAKFAVYSEIRIDPPHIPCDHNVELLNVKPGGR